MAKKKNKTKKANGLGNLPNLKNLNLSKKQKNTLVGVGIAAVAAGAYYLSKGKVDWAGLTDKISGAVSGGSGSPTAPNAEAPVDVALTNEVAKSTQHNPNNDGEFTDDGATGNAD